MVIQIEDSNFGVVDFVVFAGALGISVAIGLYFAYADRKKTSANSYMFGDKKMSPFAVAMSLAVTYVSAITVLALPVEVYTYGAVFMWTLIGNIIGSLFSAFYFLPMFCKLQCNTVYEYLELRFHRYLRMATSLLSNIQLIFYMGTTIYLPALALSIVTPLSLNASIALTSIVCTFYTTLGGMKAVIWTDVLQGAIMIFGSISVCIKISIMSGGPSNIWEDVKEGGRDNFLKFSFDPRVRSSIPALMTGYFVFAMKALGTDQPMVQRYIACGGVFRAQKSLFLKLIPSTIFTFISIASGLSMYSYFKGCDPYKAGVVKKQDQLMPLLVVDVFKDMPGMAGLFVAAAYSGTLSTVSSGMNSVATVIVNDYVMLLQKHTDGKMQLFYTKCASLFVGVMVTGVAYFASNVKGTVIRLLFSILGATSSPVLCLYVFSFFPFVNTKGAFSSLIFGLLVGVWVAIGTLSYGPNPEIVQQLPVSTEMCNLTNTLQETMEFTTPFNNNFSTTVFATEAEQIRPYIADTLYSISPYYFSAFVLIISLFVGIIVSLLTGPNQTSKADPNLFIPLLSHKILPRKITNFFRFGVPEFDEYKRYDKVVLTNGHSICFDEKETDL